MELPPPYDMTVESDMEFRKVMARTGKARLAASKDFTLLKHLKLMLEEAGAPGEWLDIDDIDEILRRVENAIRIDMPPFETDTSDTNWPTIILEGRGVLSMERKIYAEHGEVFHTKLRIDNTGRDIGKQLFRNQLVIYHNLDVEKITVHATDVGRYAWAKYGFNAIHRDDMEDIHREMLQMCGLYAPSEFAHLSEVPWGKYIPQLPPYHMAHLAVVYIPKEALDSFISDVSGDMGGSPWNNTLLRGTDGSFLLGKHVLLEGSSWGGELSLKEGSEDREILEKYIGLL